MTRPPAVYRWEEMETDHPMALIDRRRVMGEHAMLAHVTLHKGFRVQTHRHDNEQFAVVLSGRIRFTLGEDCDQREIELTSGQMLHLPPGVPHAAEAVETTVVIDIFSPPCATTGVDAG